MSKSLPWLAFSADGVVFKDGKPFKLLEIKCPFIGNIPTFSVTCLLVIYLSIAILGKSSCPESFLGSCDYLSKSGGELILKKKHTYYGQVQLGMALLGLDSTIFLMYSSLSKTFIEISIPFDYDFAKELIKKISDNYFEKMLHVYCLNKE